MSTAAGGKSTYWEGAILNLLRGVNVTAPSSVYVGVYTTLPGSGGSGGVEASGGAYARVGISGATSSWSSPSGGSTSVSNPVLFSAATASWGVVVGFGIWDASTAGNLLYWGELLGPEHDYTVDTTTETFTSNGHGFVNNLVVRFRNLGGSLPTPLSANTDYYVIGSTTNTFQVSTTQGGSAVDITAAGSGLNAAHASYIQNVANGNTLSFNSGMLTIIEG